MRVEIKVLERTIAQILFEVVYIESGTRHQGYRDVDDIIKINFYYRKHENVSAAENGSHSKPYNSDKYKDSRENSPNKARIIG